MKKLYMKTSGQAVSKMMLTLLVFLFLFCMIKEPARYISKSLEGISAWAFNVLPSVFPFMFFTKVLSSLGTMNNLTRPFSFISTKLFKTPAISIYTFFMAILSGYPVGSKMVADLFLQGKITKEEAFKMTSFCSTSGPMFIIGAVGIGMFNNSNIGYILFFSHIIGAITNGIVFRNYKTKEKDDGKQEKLIKQQNKQTPESKQTQNDIGEIVLNSTLSILCVGAIITIFFIIIECISPLLELFPTSINYFLQGFVEITKGCISLSSLSNKFLATTICSFVVSFGGISTVLQSLTMLSKLKMPTKLFIFQKFLHGVFSLIATVLLLLIFGV